jgi:hypothetical protein
LTIQEHLTKIEEWTETCKRIESEYEAKIVQMKKDEKRRRI